MIIISLRVCKLGKKINDKITMEGQRYMNEEKKNDLRTVILTC